MEFSKLKEGVVAFSSFLVSHAVWLALTLFSLYASYGAAFEQTSAPIKALLSGYGLKPLVPAIGFFVLVFILHAHRR